jgi:hypothetical protein
VVAPTWTVAFLHALGAKATDGPNSSSASSGRGSPPVLPSRVDDMTRMLLPRSICSRQCRSSPPRRARRRSGSRSRAPSACSMGCRRLCRRRGYAHRSKRRLFGLPGLVPLAVVVRLAHRPEPGRGRPPLIIEAPKLPVAPLPPLTQWNASGSTTAAPGPANGKPC